MSVQTANQLLAKVAALPFIVIGYVAGCIWIGIYCGYKWAEIGIEGDDQ